MHIKEFAAMTGLSQSKVRFYEKHGLLNAGRQENGYRDFSPEDAFRSNAFRLLLKHGFSVEDSVRMLDEEQGSEEFANSLRRRRAETEREMELLRYRMQRIDHALYHMESEPNENFDLLDCPDYLYVRVSRGRDFSISLESDTEIAAYYDLLGITTCARIIRKDDLENDCEFTDPSYIVAVPEPDSIELVESVRASSERFCLGKCIRYRRTATRAESVRKESYAPLLRYLDAHGYRLRDDILIIPLFLNLDGKGKDIEVLLVPVV